MEQKLSLGKELNAIAVKFLKDNAKYIDKTAREIFADWVYLCQLEAEKGKIVVNTIVNIQESNPVLVEKILDKLRELSEENDIYFYQQNHQIDEHGAYSISADLRWDL